MSGITYLMPGVSSNDLDEFGNLRPDRVEWNELHNPNYAGYKGVPAVESVPAEVVKPEPTIEELEKLAEAALQAVEDAKAKKAAADAQAEKDKAEAAEAAKAETEAKKLAAAEAKKAAAAEAK